MRRKPNPLIELNLLAYDSLNANICIIDNTGMIIAVNKSWRDFANLNPPVIKDYGIGVNYLTLCDSANGYCSEGAKDFANGIRLVIDGNRSEFGIEYPCNSPAENRWFIGWITPLLNTDPVCYIISHGNITNIKKKNEELEKYSLALENAPNLTAITDLNGKIEYVNTMFTQITGYTKEELIGNDPRLLNSGIQSKAFYTEMWTAIKSGKIWHGEFANKKKNGDIYWENASISSIKNLESQIIFYVKIGTDITTKKKAEEEIKSLKERMEFLVSSSPVVIYTSRLNEIFGFTSLSSNSSKILGYSHSDLVSGKINWIDLIHPEDRDKVKKDFDSLSDDEYSSSEYRVRMSNNLYSWVRVDRKIIYSTGSLQAEIVGTILNIDSRRKSEEKILYKLSLENTLNKISLSFTEFTEINDAINLALKELAELVKVDSGLLFKISDDGNLISNTHEWYSEAACSKKEILQDIPSASFRHLLGKLKKNECVILDDVTSLPADASLEKEEFRRDKVFAILAVPLFCLGKFYGYITFNDLKGPHEWIAEDIQVLRSAAELISRGIERKTYEKILRENEEHFRTIVENVGEGVGIVDENENFIFANPAAHKIFGIEGENLIGSNLSKFIINEQFNKVLDQTSIRKHGKPGEYEVEIIRPDSEIRYILITSSPRIDGNNIYRGSFAVFRDITDRKRAELLVEKYAAELKEANSGKDKLFSFISHDLKNTFNGLLGVSDILENNIENLEKNELNYFGKELNKLVKDQYKQLENLLTWSVMQFGKVKQQPNSFNLKEIAETNIDVLKDYYFKKNIRITNKIEDIWIMEDPAIINSIFQNLILNAVKFTGISGNITLFSHEKPESLEIMVEDTGCGISEENLKKLFNISTRFTLPGTNGEAGSGLGLLICKEMVEKMGGKLSVNSKYGEGSTFTFSIPADKVGRPQPGDHKKKEIFYN